jgi:hypothetical protein
VNPLLKAFHEQVERPSILSVCHGYLEDYPLQSSEIQDITLIVCGLKVVKAKL